MPTWISFTYNYCFLISSNSFTFLDKIKLTIAAEGLWSLSVYIFLLSLALSLRNNSAVIGRELLTLPAPNQTDPQCRYTCETFEILANISELTCLYTIVYLRFILLFPRYFLEGYWNINFINNICFRMSVIFLLI